MSRYAEGKDALAVCDECNFQLKYLDLKWEIVNRRRTGRRVCPACWDKDQPQLWIGELDKSDPQALKDPRPDTLDKAFSRGWIGWNPVVAMACQVAFTPPKVTTT